VIVIIGMFKCAMRRMCALMISRSGLMRRKDLRGYTRWLSL